MSPPPAGGPDDHPSGPGLPTCSLPSRIAAAALAHAVVLALLAGAVGSTLGKSPPLAAAALMAASLAALAGAWCLSPDPGRAAQLVAFIHALSPKARWWAAGGVYAGWVLVSAACREAAESGSAFGVFLRVSALYLVPSALWALWCYEGVDAYRARHGLPPRPRPRVPEGSSSSRPAAEGRGSHAQWASPPARTDVAELRLPPRVLLRVRVRRAISLHVATTALLVQYVAARDPLDGREFPVIRVPILTVLGVAAFSATFCLTPDPRASWSLRRPFGAEGPYAALGIWAVALAASAFGLGLVRDRVDGAVMLNWAHDLYAWLGSRVAFTPWWVAAEVTLLYAAVAGAAAYRGYEGVPAYLARAVSSPEPEPRTPDRDLARRILAVVERNRRAGVPDDATERTIIGFLDPTRPPVAGEETEPLTQDAFHQS